MDEGIWSLIELEELRDAAVEAYAWMEGATPSPSAHPLHFGSGSETWQGPSFAPRTHLCAHSDNA
eukprot:SAG11_NODE_3723_length_2260_cov_24.008329_4_plen_64_part_01